MLDKLEKFYNWISAPSPALIDITMGIISITITVSLITLFGWAVCKIIGWYIIPVLFFALFCIFCAHMVKTSRNYEGGIRQWWKDRPWK